eukprot:Plantae.Rhodophyta-Hildenbrandia_rubra.ctg7758.p1 GENE.Plantae.Rhodophyta-Hildenbrandia_rubra.ctg7758~~Plantae.Rhodophyta-Hildenbrandia_rubra.ctg7758.p1  ORF type:complete len:826 (-),score=121.15 Plantae.Rhodophyta-Hildenbrandia_rubra.ctg7758:1312-3789(-)
MRFQRTDDPFRRRLPIDGLPEASSGKILEIGYVRWSPDGERVAFCIYEPLFGLELWCADVSTRRAWCVLPKQRLNAVCGDPFTWCSDSRNLLAKFVIEDRKPPQKSVVPHGPVVQENTSSKPAPGRTYQDLLKDRHDMALFEHYTTCQLARVDVESNTQVPLGLSAGFRRASPSPDGRYILVDCMVPPYAYMTPAGRFPRRVEVWSMDTGEIISTVAEIPMQDKIPIAFDGVGEGPRGIGWRSDAKSTLYWVEAQDGGDPSNVADTRDCVFTLPAPFTGAPRKLASLAWRYNGIVWGSDSVALLTERRYKTRSARSYLLAPGPEHEFVHEDSSGDPDALDAYAFAKAQGPCCVRACSLAQGEAPKRMILSVPNWEDRYNDPGSVYTQRNEAGKLILRLVYPKGRGEVSSTQGEVANGEARLGQPYFLMHGAGASDEGDRPFMSLFDTVTGDSVRLWQSTPPKFEGIITVMSEDKETNMPNSLLLIQESPTQNPNFYVLDIDLSLDASKRLKELKQESNFNFAKSPLRALTAFPHPAPELANVQREIVHYERADGIRLNGTLYLPAGYDAGRDGPLPTFIWAYPREYKSAAYAGQVRGSPYRFVRLARTPLYWLARGYAIFDGPGMPIIGEGETEANDSYVEQLVMSAEAAVDYVVSRGIARRDKIGIGGHSYGAFMTVNLLAHAPDLFCCGIARSGAYNRTLTPFGFQSEERTLWQSPEIYTRMSPYMYADKIKKPLLLIHGDADNNPGTFPMQSERLYQALKGHGRAARYVSLPHEGHGYRAKESVLHTLAEMTEWLDRFCGRTQEEETLFDPYDIKVEVSVEK